jgi:hypothetical protein
VRPFDWDSLPTWYRWLFGCLEVLFILILAGLTAL